MMKNNPMLNGFLICGFILIWTAYQSVTNRIDQAQSDANTASSTAYDAQSRADEAFEKANDAEERIDRIEIWSR